MVCVSLRNNPEECVCVCLSVVGIDILLFGRTHTHTLYVNEMQLQYASCWDTHMLFLLVYIAAEASITHSNFHLKNGNIPRTLNSSPRPFSSPDGLSKTLLLIIFKPIIFQTPPNVGVMRDSSCCTPLTGWRERGVDSLSLVMISLWMYSFLELVNERDGPLKPVFLRTHIVTSAV